MQTVSCKRACLEFEPKSSNIDEAEALNSSVAWSHDPPTLQAGIEDSAKSNAVMVGIGLDEVQQPANGLQYREASVGGPENSIAAGIPEESSGSQEPQQDPMEALAAYRKRVEQLVNRGQRKPDMVAYKELRQPSVEGLIGNLPGIAPGLRVSGKGELAILGIHCNICGGIYSKPEGACAIALSGGYADDDDTGNQFWYTGMGGQKGGIQVADQTWDCSGNRALKLSHENSLPVRVVRRLAPSRGYKGAPIYIYEGLYSVAEAVMEKGTHGRKICRFKMVALPGQAIVSTKVEVIKQFKKVKLASLMDPKRAAPTKKPALKVAVKAKQASATAITQSTATLKRKLSLASTSGRLMEDFSRGVETRRIPVYGHSMKDLETLPKDFCYVSKAFEWGDNCGIKAMGLSYLMPDSKLTETLEWGLLECGPSCKEKACKHSHAVSRGITLPLEIFKTETRGWGLRCAVGIPIGRFICEYAGAICSDTEADTRCQEYLFDLDHFILLRKGDPEPQEGRVVYPELPVDFMDKAAAGTDVHLSIDGSQCGNVGRFVNHSCDGNIVVQPVFTQGCSALHYRVALFALKDIKPYEELTYSYGWVPLPDAEKEVWCTCGAPNCQGRLL